jgi:hypothetical protein
MPPILRIWPGYWGQPAEPGNLIWAGPAGIVGRIFMGPFLSSAWGLKNYVLFPKSGVKTYENSLFSFKLNIILILTEREA